ncbi:radical SAM protein [Methylobacter luteus]|uniref:radical SAM protein n=1 Tax=Methylobacter luteus TaxID=415 RepID=UPI00040952C2|nr:radical SAM protein [Methylobacter luteus]
MTELAIHTPELHQLRRTMKLRRGPDGIHLFDRKSGTNILIDEQIPPMSSWTNCPRQISIALTNACDLKCEHCYALKRAAQLSKEQVKRWMVELDESGCFGIGFGGGEPTLHPDLVELCQFGQQKTGLAITLTTHGHRLTDNLISQLQGSVNFIRVSMDGVGVTYESIRDRSFDELKRKLYALQGTIPFGINYVVNRRTIDDLNTAAQFAESAGAAELLLLPEEPVGLGQKIDLVSLEALYSWVADYKGNLRLSISSRYREMVETQLALEKEPEHMAFAHVDAEGVLKRTSFDSTGFKIGNAGLLAAFQNFSMG